jgi:hypothetical protein
MEPLILDFDLGGQTYVVKVTALQLNGATQYVAEVNTGSRIVYVLQKNGLLQPDDHQSDDVQLVNAIATRILEAKNAQDRHW